MSVVAPGCSLVAGYYVRKCSSETENRRFEGKRATKSTTSAVTHTETQGYSGVYCSKPAI